MKLKKLLASCVLIAAMGITLTGCSFNIGNILNENSSVVNDENSSTDNESSSDTNIKNPNSGTWVLTETKYYAYKNGEEQYVSKQNEYYKYRCYFRGVTDDNFIKFQTSGGFYSPTNSDDNTYIDAYHLCSIPDNSYPAGGPVTLQVKTYSENIKGHWYPGEGAWIGIACEDKEETAGMDPYLYFLQNMSIKFYSALKDKYDLWVDGNTNDTLTVKMPEEADIGDRIAILFSGASAYDSWSSAPQDDYGGYVWYAWIYTFTK